MRPMYNRSDNCTSIVHNLNRLSPLSTLVITGNERREVRPILSVVGNGLLPNVDNRFQYPVSLAQRQRGLRRSGHCRLRQQPTTHTFSV